MIKVRDMKPEDIKAVAEIEQMNFSKPWKEEGFLSAVRTPNAIYFVAEEEGEIVGYAGMWVSLDEGEITNVSVHPEHWGKKTGRSLMDALENAGKKAGVTSFFLEVRQSNTRAQALYKTCGFRTAGIRKNFYEAPVEHAIVMCKK